MPQSLNLTGGGSPSVSNLGPKPANGDGAKGYDQ